MLLHERLSEIENKVAARVSAAAIGFRTSTPAGDASYESIGISHGTERFRDDGTGLEVSCAVERLHEAIVLHSTIRNTSDAPVTLDMLAPLHVVIEHDPRDWVHYHAHGGITDYQLPTSAYAVKRTFELTPLLRLQSHPLGRSSNEDLPLLISVAESLNAGFFCGLEWSATWTFSF